MNDTTKRFLQGFINKHVTMLLLLLLVSMSVMAQKADYSKMSSLVRMAARSAGRVTSDGTKYRPVAVAVKDGGSICAFVKIKDNADRVLQNAGCRCLARFGDIYIADIPLGSLSLLSSDKRVERIEAGRSNSLCLDTVSAIVNAEKLYSGEKLPQAYTGKGVVMGVMDVGFDLTHPNFFDKYMQTTRIRRFWDQLSPDSIGSSLYVGADYRTAADILAYGRSHDGLIDTHGTHTLGIATGTGCGTPYRGMAPDADICLVSNAVNTDIPLIPEEMLYKYTTATDALGFKYMFDYADEVGKPCVISFSEGSTEMLDGEQQLYYETLAAMTGKGKIIVASAANSGYYDTYLHKPKGKDSDGVFLSSRSGAFSVSALGSAPFSFRITAYGRDGSSGISQLSRVLSTADVVAQSDSLLVDTLYAFGKELICQIEAYKTALAGSPVAFDMVISSESGGSSKVEVSLEVMGNAADVQLFSNGVEFHKSGLNPALCNGESLYSVACPGAAPAVICVGATSYRTSYKGADGYNHAMDWGKDGAVAGYSSVGPTRFNLCKPDVVAPGTNVYSSMSSYYAEAVESGGYMSYVSSYLDYEGRRYPWAAFSGTSQSAPVVAGAIALWLEANPTLTTEDVLGIFDATCNRRNIGCGKKKNIHCGYGEIDVYAGMLKVLELDGIEEITKHHPAAATIEYTTGGKVEVRLTAPYETPKSASLKVFSVSGKKMSAHKLCFESGSAVVNIGNLQGGVYVLQLSSDKASCCGSVLVRKD